MKRGQVTVFIIVGILLLLIFALILFFKGSSSKTDLETSKVEGSFENLNILQIEQTCLNSVSKEAVLFIAGHGGYYDLPEKNYNSQVPLYLDAEGNYFPTLEVLEREISKYVEKQMDFCLHDVLEAIGSELIIGIPQASVRIFPEKVSVILNQKIEHEYESGVQTKDVFSQEVPVRLGTIHSLLSEFMEQETNDRHCASCLSLLAQANELNVENYFADSSTFVFVIRDDKVLVRNTPFVFMFANIYNFKAPDFEVGG